MCRGGDSTVVGDFDKSLTFGGAGGNVGRDADSVPTCLEENQGTAFVNDRVEKFESSVGVGLGNRLHRMKVAIQNLTQCAWLFLWNLNRLLGLKGLWLKSVTQAEGRSMIVGLVHRGDLLIR